MTGLNNRRNYFTEYSATVIELVTCKYFVGNQKQLKLVSFGSKRTSESTYLDLDNLLGKSARMFELGKNLMMVEKARQVDIVMAKGKNYCCCYLESELVKEQTV